MAWPSYSVRTLLAVTGAICVGTLIFGATLQGPGVLTAAVLLAAVLLTSIALQGVAFTLLTVGARADSPAIPSALDEPDPPSRAMRRDAAFDLGE